jgi:hypothetical protein
MQARFFKPFQTGIQSNTFNCTVRRPLNSFTAGANARSNFPTGSALTPHSTKLWPGQRDHLTYR